VPTFLSKRKKSLERDNGTVSKCIGGLGVCGMNSCGSGQSLLWTR
jgi:hypothetical protein